MLLHIKMKKSLSLKYIERECLLLSPSLEKVWLERPTVNCCTIGGDCAIGSPAPLIVIYGQQDKAAGNLASGLFRRFLPWCWLNRALWESIVSLLSVWACPPGPALLHTAWGFMSHWPDESNAFYGWAYSSSEVGLQLWHPPSLPLFRKSLALTLSATAGTFENNCLYDCCFSYVFEGV